MGDIMASKGVPLADYATLDQIEGKPTLGRLILFPEGDWEGKPLAKTITLIPIPSVRFRIMAAQLSEAQRKTMADLAIPTAKPRDRAVFFGPEAQAANRALLGAYSVHVRDRAGLALLDYGAALLLAEEPPVPPKPSSVITVLVPTDEINAAIVRLRAEADRVIGLAGATSGGLEYAIVAQELQRVRAERDALRARSLGPKAEAAMEAVWWLAGALVRAEETGDRDDRKLADRLHDQLHGHAMVLALSGERRADRRTDLTPDARRAAEVLLLAEQLAQARSAMRETWLPAATREADQWEKTFLARLDALYDEAEAARDAEARATVEAERRAVRAVTGGVRPHATGE